MVFLNITKKRFSLKDKTTTKENHKRLNEAFWAICARQCKEQEKERLEYCLSQIDACLDDAESSLDDLEDDLKKWKENIIIKQEEEIEYYISFASSCVELARKLLIELEQELENQRS